MDNRSRVPDVFFQYKKDYALSKHFQGKGFLEICVNSCIMRTMMGRKP